MASILTRHRTALLLAVMGRPAPIVSQPLSDCDPLSACLDPVSCPTMQEHPPAGTFDVTFETTAGSFTIRAVTSWAPPYALRFWRLSRLGYMEGASFYRVDRISESKSWVVQFGYRGDPSTDQCWDQNHTSNQTWSVQPPGNIRGAVAFSMDAVKNTGQNPNCTAEDYCAQGYSTNIYINYANNTRLDPHGFSVFGFVLPPGMEVVDRLYAEYGEVADLCPEEGGNTFYSQFCRGLGRNCRGVNMSRLLTEGNAYLQREKPLLDRVLKVMVASGEVQV